MGEMISPGRGQIGQ